MRHCGLMILIVLFCFSSHAQKPEFTFYGLKIFVDDLKTAERFYQDILGFEAGDEADRLLVKTGSWPLTVELAQSESSTNYPKGSRTGLTVQTYKLLPRIEEFRSKGVSFYDSLLTRNGVGISIPFRDPSGNVLSLMEVQIRPVDRFDGVRIYNTGVTISDMEAVTHFYESILGFEEWSRAYLPDALPLKHTDGSFAFMIHRKEGLQTNSAKYGEAPQMLIQLSTEKLGKAKSYLSENGIEVWKEKDRLICRDAEGNLLEVIEMK